MAKKTLAMLMALVMAASLCVIPAAAEGVALAGSGTEADPYQITADNLEAVAERLTGAAPQGRMYFKVTGDVALSKPLTIPAGFDVSLALEEHTLTGSLSVKGALTVENGTVTAAGTTETIALNAGSTFVANHCAFDHTGSDFYTIYSSGAAAKADLTDCTVNYNGSASWYHPVSITSDDIALTDCTVTTSMPKRSAANLKVPDASGTAVISGGSYTNTAGTDPQAVQIAFGSTGTLTLKDDVEVTGLVVQGTNPNCNGIISVEGGQYNHESPVVADESKIDKVSIKGGYFKNKDNISAYVAAPYMVISNSNETYPWTIAGPDANAKAYIAATNTSYDSASAALAAATDGQTVLLLSNAAVTPGQAAGKTIDGGNYALTVSGTLAELMAGEPTVRNVSTTTFQDGTFGNMVAVEGKLTGGTPSEELYNAAEGCLAEGYLRGSGSSGGGSDRAIAAESTFEAKIGKVGYEFLTHAVSVAYQNDNESLQVNDEIVLLKDVDSGISVFSPYTTFTLNLNGHSITEMAGTKNALIISTLNQASFANNADITVKNGALKGKDFGVVTLGTLRGVTLKLNDVVVSADAATGTAAYLAAGGVATIEDCTISGAQGIQLCGGGLTLGGTTSVTATGADGRAAKEGDGSIPDGAAVSIVSRAGYAPITTVSISGGAYTSAKSRAMLAYTWSNNAASDWTGETGLVSGGTFSSDVSAYVAQDHYCTQNGQTYTVTGPAAAIGNAKYPTLESAVTAAQAGETITLLNDSSISTPIAIQKNLTIDGNGHTLTGVTGGSGEARQGMFDLNNKAAAVTFALKHANLINQTSWSSPSGISVRASDQTVQLDGVTMDTKYYCVIAGVLNGNGSEKMDNIRLTINDSELTGYAAIYYRTNSTTDTINDPVLTVTGSKLYGRGVNGYGNDFSTIVYNGTRRARTTISDSVLSNTFYAGNRDANEGIIQFNCWGAYEKDAVVTIRNSVIKTSSNSAAPNVIQYTCSENLDAGNKVIIDQLTFTRGENDGDLIRVLRNGNELMATGIDLKTVLEIAELQDATNEPAQKVIKSGDNVLVPMNTSVNESTVIPEGVTVTVAAGATVTVADQITLTGSTGAALVVNGSVTGVANVSGTGTYFWSQDQWVRQSSGSSGSGGGSTTKPTVDTETKTEGGVKVETTTETVKNKDGSTTTNVTEKAENIATGEKTERKVTETVSKDGSVTKEEVKTTTAADGTNTEEKNVAISDKTTGTETRAQVVTDEAGRTTATARTEAKAETKVQEDGAAIATVDKKTAEKLTEQAKAAAEAAEGADKVEASVVLSADLSAEEAKAAESVIVEVPKTAVDTLAKETAADLVVSTPVADVTVPNAALTELAGQKGDTVAIKTEKTADGGVKVTVTVGDTEVETVSGGLKASLPAEGATPGTVAVLVHADGTEEIIRKSVAADGTVVAPLDGSATIKLVDNGKHFPDTEDHWAGDAVEFVTARNLFQGVGEDSFAPGQQMTRGMLVTVLNRLENEAKADGSVGFADVPEDAYYTGAVAWASEKGIVTGTGAGFDPEAPITRQQLATILYRYLETQGADLDRQGDLSAFTDGAQVDGWAQAAMAYAVGAGLMSGKGGGVLDPNGTATRAEVAVVLQRLVENMA